ncbi:MAG: nickel ABC transporter permease subunit NikC [Campylobacter curvus]
MRGLVLKLAFVVAALMVIFCVLAPVIAPYDPETIDLSAKFMPVCSEHILGTDHLGRDVFSRLLYGSSVSLGSTFATLGLILLIGVLVGAISGFAGGRVDQVLMRICDVFFSVPTIVLALFLVGVLGTGLINVIIAIAVSHWAWYARIVRSVVLSLKNKEYILITRISGASEAINFKKNMLRPILSQCVILGTLDIGHIMLHISALSFLGLGVRAPKAEWGIMISDAKDFIFTHSELMLYPGVALFLCVASFNIIGDHLRDKLDAGRNLEVCDEYARA